MIRYSLIVPTWNAAAWLPLVLAPLSNLGPDWEVLVVDDGSQDGTVQLLRDYPVRILARAQRGGQAVARNEAAQLAAGHLLVFVDSDVVVESDTLHSMVSFLEERPELDGVFGSYSEWGYHQETPLSRFRNLLHRYVHQQSRGPMGSFWTGLGVIRRTSFARSGGFDPRLTGIEDVELGKRISDGGGKFWLEPSFEGRHLKRWSLPSMVKTDLMVRAIPWTFYGWMGLTPTRGLNLSPWRLLAPAFLLLALFCLPFRPERSGAALLTYLVLNLPYYHYFGTAGGCGLALRSTLYLTIHHLCCLLGWALGTLKYGYHRLKGRL